MSTARTGRTFLFAGTALFLVAGALDIALRSTYPWADFVAEVIVGIAVLSLIIGWIVTHFARRDVDELKPQ